MKSFFLTDIGSRRKANQDYVFSTDKPIGSLPNLYIVADGMGGHKAGDYASRVCTESVISYIKENKEHVTPISILDAAIKYANSRLVKDSMNNEELEGMGTTLVTATAVDNVMYIANIGDSRLYVIDSNNHNITQITEDHSLVEEMIKKGELERKDARFHPNKNIITRALGAHEDILIDFFEIDLQKGDIILLCSDGLTNMVDDDETLDIICCNRDNCEAAAVKLVARANQNGGKDNISVVLAIV